MQVTFTVSEAKKVYQSAGETASWYHDIEIPAGTYEASCRLIGHEPCSLEEAYWVTVRITGTCVGGWLPSYRGNGVERDFGKPMDYFIQVYGYQVRHALEQDSPTPWALTETSTVGK